MKGNAAIMSEALKRAFCGVWFWRICAVVCTVCAVQHLAGLALEGAYGRFGVQTWLDFARLKAEAMKTGIDVAVPSARAAMQMNAATAFLMFIGFVFGGISMLGIASVMLKTAKNDGASWFHDSLAGFSSPFGVAWMMCAVLVKVMLWSLLFIVPGIVAGYRYSQCWNIKAENPGWSALRCIAESSRMMKGFKMRRFMLDLAFMAIVLALLAVSVSAMALLQRIAGDSALPAVLVSAGMTAGVMFVSLWVAASRAVFYRELKSAVAAGAALP